MGVLTDVKARGVRESKEFSSDMRQINTPAKEPAQGALNDFHKWEAKYSYAVRYWKDN
nr:hypothetical protein [Bacteroidetes bacterium endosymbiont of Geopemphigus sp.]